MKTGNPSRHAAATTGARLLGLLLASLPAAGIAALTACSRGETGSVTLRWTPPTENEDGSELDDLAGYRVYWRKASGPIEQMVVIEGESSTEFEIENLPDGEWHAGVTAFTEEGLESDIAIVVFTTRRGEVTVDESILGRIVSRAEFAEPVLAGASAAQ